MSLHSSRLYYRRILRRRQRQAEKLGQEASINIEKNLFTQFSKLKLVWRFTAGWLLLFVLIIGCLLVQMNSLKSYYQTLVPVPGGIYTEGIQGSFTTANPLFAVSDVDTTVSRLIFASLLTYNSQNQLVGDLARSWTVNTAGTVYTVNLRPHLYWQDGQPLTAADVLFTYQTIQNPNTQSPLFASWQDVKVTAVNNLTVNFSLPNPLSSFPYSLTNGIVPKHILGTVNPAELSSASFNTNDPIGAGPFKWGSLEISNNGLSNAQDQINLLPSTNYWAGMPKLSSLTIDTFPSYKDLLSAYQAGQLTAMVDSTGSLPRALVGDNSSQVYNLPLTAAVYVFFNTTSPILNDIQVRQALVDAANRPAILKSLSYSAIPVDEPLLEGQLGYNKAYAQPTDQVSRADALLSADGWTLNSEGLREKNGQILSFTFYLPNNAAYMKVAKLLVAEWRAIGAEVKAQPEPSVDFQSILSSHSYSAVLYGISIGVDPDVYVYWDSLSASPNSTEQLNFSLFKSSIADSALEAGRTRLGDQLRAIKYQAFLQVWQQDAPALGLYQPSLLYISHQPIYGLSNHQINSDAGVFNNVQKWMIQTGWVTNAT